MDVGYHLGRVFDRDGLGGADFFSLLDGLADVDGAEVEDLDGVAFMLSRADDLHACEAAVSWVRKGFSADVACDGGKDVLPRFYNQIPASVDMLFS